MSGAGRRMIGAYQPRPRGAVMADAFDDARHALARLSRLVIMRGAGLVVLLATIAALIALVSYDSGDASLNIASGEEISNLLGPLGATAADLLLQAFGFAAIAFLAPPHVRVGICRRFRIGNGPFAKPADKFFGLADR